MRLHVEDMVCNGCKAKVGRALHMVRGVTTVDIDLDAKQATAIGSAPVDDMIAAVHAAGYNAICHRVPWMAADCR